MPCSRSCRRRSCREAEQGRSSSDSTANSYRLDPDGWYGRNILSTAPENRRRIGYKNEKADQIILAARKERDQAKRRQMYADVETLVNRTCRCSTRTSCR